MQATDRGLSVFRHYLPVQFRIGKKFLNPLYKDTKASCNIYYDRRHSVYKMKDFGNEEYSGDCFELVGTMTGLSCRNAKDFVEIMRIIDHDLHLGLEDGHESCTGTASIPAMRPVTAEQWEKKIRPYSFVARTFNEEDLAFGGSPVLRKAYYINIMYNRYIRSPLPPKKGNLIPLQRQYKNRCTAT